MICIYSYFKIIGDCLMFFDDILKTEYLETEYYVLGNENFSLDFGANILNLMFLNDLFMHFNVWYMLRFDNVTDLSLFFKFILFQKLISSL